MIFVNLKTKNINAIQYNQVPETNGHGCISNYCCYPSLVGEDRKICYEWCIFLKKLFIFLSYNTSWSQSPLLPILPVPTLGFTAPLFPFKSDTWTCKKQMVCILDTEQLNKYLCSQACPETISCTMNINIHAQTLACVLGNLPF